MKEVESGQWECIFLLKSFAEINFNLKASKVNEEKNLAVASYDS